MAEKANGKDKAAKPLCFVVGPIGKDGTPERKHADLLLNAVIKHTLTAEEFGYRVKRGDEDSDPGMIGDRMISDVINAELVIADLTDLNPNAFYELGIRHSTEKPTIHVARSGTALPFDTVTHRTILVDLTDWHSIEQSRARLAESARAIKLPDYKVSNPITQANASFKMRQSEDPRDQVIATMAEEIESIKALLGKAADVATRRTRPNVATGISEPSRLIPGDPPPVRKLRTFEVWDGDEALGIVEATGFNGATNAAIEQFPAHRYRNLRVVEVVEGNVWR
jgi:hypothetical protein